MEALNQKTRQAFESHWPVEEKKAEKAPTEKKPKASKKLPKEGGSAAGYKKKKKKSVPKKNPAIAMEKNDDPPPSASLSHSDPNPVDVIKTRVMNMKVVVYVGFFSGRKRESIFKSPDDPHGKVGVTESGKGLTDFQRRGKHLHLKEGTIDGGDE